MKTKSLLRILVSTSCVVVTALLLGRMSLGQVYATAPNPAWWVDNTGAFSQYDDYQYKNGRTHQGTFYSGTGTVDSSSLGASYDGVTAVGPRYADVGQHVYVYFTSDAGASQEDEWQCTELVKRFLYLEYGVPSLSGTSGDQVVANYASTYSTVFKSVNNLDGSNSTNHVWPKAGDVLSYSDVHTAIVTNVNITDATNGNATLTIVEQNASSTGTTTQQFVGWKIKGDIDDPSDTGSDTVTGWLTPKNYVKTFGTSSSYDYIYSLKKTSDGGSVALGYTSGNFWVAKLDAGGSVTWQKTYIAGSPQSIIQTSDGGYLVGGYYSNGTRNIAVLLKLDGTGGVVWYNKYDYVSNSAYINSVAEVSSGDYVAVGAVDNNHRAWVFQVSKTDGSISWQKTLGDCNGYAAIATNVLPVSDGIIVIGQTGCDPSNNSRGWIFKLNSTQGLAWQKVLNTGTILYSVAQLNGGDFIASGIAISANGGGWLVKFDGSGSILSERALSVRQGTKGLFATSDGGYIVLDIYWPNTSNNDLWVGKFNSSDSLSWQKGYGGSNEDDGYSIQSTNAGGYIIGASTQTYGLGLFDGWVIETDSSGNPSNSNNACSIVGSPTATSTTLTTSLLTSSANYASSSVSPSSASVTPSTASLSSTSQCTN